MKRIKKVDVSTCIVFDVLANLDDNYWEEVPDMAERRRIAQAVVNNYDAQDFFNYMDGLIQEEINNVGSP